MGPDGATRTEFVACDYCETPFETDTRYPVTVREDADGAVELYSFCDKTCQEAWESQSLWIA